MNLVIIRNQLIPIEFLIYHSNYPIELKHKTHTVEAKSKKKWISSYKARDVINAVEIGLF